MSRLSASKSSRRFESIVNTILVEIELVADDLRTRSKTFFFSLPYAPHGPFGGTGGEILYRRFRACQAEMKNTASLRRAARRMWLPCPFAPENGCFMPPAPWQGMPAPPCA